MAKKVKSRLRLKDRLAIPKNFKNKNNTPPIIDEPKRVDLSIKLIYSNNDMYLNADDLLRVVQCINDNGGGIKDLLKLLKDG